MRKQKRLSVQEQINYWDSRYPTQRITYSGRPLPNGNQYAQDVRHFIWPVDYQLDDIYTREILPKLGGINLDVSPLNGLLLGSDRIAQVCQQWVVKNIKYVSDEKLGASEYWLYPAEALKLRAMDCEDGANLLASLLLMAGIEPFRVRNTCGEVEGGGHSYVTFLSAEFNKHYILDWCYAEDSKFPFSKRKPLNDRKEYFGGSKTWFSFNHLFSWGAAEMSVNGRVHQ